MKISLNLNLFEDESLLIKKASKKAGINPSDVKYFKILKKSVDARKKGDIKINYSVEIDTKEPIVTKIINKEYVYPKQKIAIIGLGPAGLFAGLTLARNGFCPIIIERGSNVLKRQKAVRDFITTKKLNTECNIQFGEGGAGTFSDGKLNTGVKSPLKKQILEDFVKFGAPQEILYLSKPHIGSDFLPATVKGIRQEIIRLGGEVWFDTKFCGYKSKNGKINSILCQNKKAVELEVSNVILAIGHSSRDTFLMLHDKGVFMEQKDMAVGFRIEHKQDLINKAQYGKHYNNPKLGSADYKLVSHACDRGVFSFCMCPGGQVVPATSEENSVVTNGMSNFARKAENANSAIVVQTKKCDYGSGVLAGIEFQRNLEKKAYNVGGGEYSAPIQLVGDFLKNQNSKKLGSVKPSYSLGTEFYPLHTFLPVNMTTAIQSALVDMDKKLSGFAVDDAVLSGVETRTSSPVRVVRNEKMQSITIENLYPTGELGYSGGIMSSAIDGIKCANAIMQNYEKTDYKC